LLQLLVPSASQFSSANRADGKWPSAPGNYGAPWGDLDVARALFERGKTFAPFAQRALLRALLKTVLLNCCSGRVDLVDAPQLIKAVQGVEKHHEEKCQTL